MKSISVSKKLIDLDQFKMRSAKEADYSTLITESTLIYEGDKLMVAYVELDMDCRDVVKALQTIKYEKNTRTSGLVTTSRIFGFSPRNILRKDFCSATSLAKEQPGHHATIAAYAAKVGEYYEQLNPDLYNQHQHTTQQHVIGEYRIKQSPFTSGIINKNNPLKYHFDTGNFEDVWSGMLVFKQDIQGGYLSVPQYDVGFELKHNSLLMFDGQGLLHGVTPIKRMSRAAFRYSIVYYSLRQMWNCLPITDELLRIRKLRTEREEKRSQPRTKEEVKK